MADFGNAVKQSVREAIVQPLAGEGKEFAKTFVTSITGSPLTPEQQEEVTKKKAEEQKNLATAQANVDRLVASENTHMQQKAIALQEKNQEVQEEAEKRQVHQLEVQEQQESQAVLNAKRAVEVKNQGAG